MNKHILYISSILPRQGTGGWIVMLRHLKRLENSGWKISLVVQQQMAKDAQIPSSWNVIMIPLRRWWWLPVKTYLPSSFKIRLLLWQIECERALKNNIPDSILTILGDDYALLASRLSHALKIPLSVIIHDDLKLRAKTTKERREIENKTEIILCQSSTVWIVSPEMKKVFPFNDANNIRVLPPIPEGNSIFTEWKDSFCTEPIIAHAGSFYEFHVPYFHQIANALEKINGKLLIVTKKSNPALMSLQKRCNNIIHKETFTNNRDAFNFLSGTASCMVVCYPYPVKEHEWTLTSFPSRMIEFMHIGIPFLVIADPRTGLGNWATKNNWQAYLDCLNEDNTLQFVKEVIKKDKWLSMARQSRGVAQNEFNPEIIQSQFESEILSAISKNSHL